MQYSIPFDRPVTMLMYVTLKPVNIVFGLDQDTVREDSVTLLKSISVADSGPSQKKSGFTFDK